MKNSAHRGSVASFVIIGVVLAGLLLGGIYLVRQNMARIADNNTVAVDGIGGGPSEAEAPAADQSATENSEEASSSESKTAEQQSQDAVAEAVKKQAETEQKAREERAAAEAAANAAASTPRATPTTGRTLPETGLAEDALIAVLGGSLLLATTIAYLRSRAAL